MFGLGPLPNANLIISCIKTHHLRVHVSGNFKTIDPLQNMQARRRIDYLGIHCLSTAGVFEQAVEKAPGKIGVAIDVKMAGRDSRLGRVVSQDRTELL